MFFKEGHQRFKKFRQEEEILYFQKKTNGSHKDQQDIKKERTDYL